MPKITSTLISKKTVAKNTYLCAVHIPSVDEKTLSKIVPGCVFSWLVADKTYRSYSLAYMLNLDDKPSTLTHTETAYPPFVSSELQTIESGIVCYFLIAAKGEGLGAQFLNSIAEGESITMIGPSGKFNLRYAENKVDEKHKILIGTGTGLAPYIGMSWELYNKGLIDKTAVLAGLNGFDGNWISEFLAPGTNLVVMYTPPKEKLEEGEYNGLVTECVRGDIEKQYYLCGHPKMVESVEKILLESENPPEIYKENFAK